MTSKTQSAPVSTPASGASHSDTLAAANAAGQRPADYQIREIGGGDWRRVTKEQMEAVVSDPHIDYRVLYAEPDRAPAADAVALPDGEPMPCPFCGSEKLDVAIGLTAKPSDYIMCNDETGCGAMISREDTQDGNLIAAWNRRDAATSAAALDALQRYGMDEEWEYRSIYPRAWGEFVKLADVRALLEHTPAAKGAGGQA